MKNLRHAGIYVKDLEKMKEFYCNVFNLEILVHEREQGNYIDHILGTQGMELELYKLKFEDGSLIELLKTNMAGNIIQTQQVFDIGSIHLAITVENLDDLYIKLKQKEAELLSSIRTSPDGKVKICFCKDPEGNYLELVEEVREEKG